MRADAVVARVHGPAGIGRTASEEEFMSAGVAAELAPPITDLRQATPALRQAIGSAGTGIVGGMLAADAATSGHGRQDDRVQNNPTGTCPTLHGQCWAWRRIRQRGAPSRP